MCERKLEGASGSRAARRRLVLAHRTNGVRPFPQPPSRSKRKARISGPSLFPQRRPLTPTRVSLEPRDLRVGDTGHRTGHSELPSPRESPGPHLQRRTGAPNSGAEEVRTTDEDPPNGAATATRRAWSADERRDSVAWRTRGSAWPFPPIRMSIRSILPQLACQPAEPRRLKAVSPSC